MQIEYEIRDTDIGKGIFALSDISKGKYIWKYNSKNKTNIQLNKIYNVIEYNESSCKTYLSKLSFTPLKI
jgi:glucose dehydrogenase